MSERLFVTFGQPAGIMPRDPRGWAGEASDVTVVEDRDLITGRAWQFVAGGLVELVPVGDLDAATPDHVTITTGISVDWPAITGTVSTLAMHGDDATSTWRLVAEVLDAAARTAQLSLWWRNAAATLWVVAAGPIVRLDRPAVVIVSRERTAEGFAVRWAISGEAAGEVTGIPLDIVVPAAGELVTVGEDAAAGTPAVGWRMEWLQVLDEARAIEEMVVVGRRFSVWAPNMMTALRRLEPADVYSRDPASLIDREVRVEAVSYSLARAAIDYFVTGMAPGLAYGDLLDRWERVLQTGQPPGASIAERRAAISAHMRLDGSEADEAKIALESVFGLEAADIVIDELDTVNYSEDFATTVTSGGYYVSGFDPARWVQVGASRFTFAHVGGSSLYRIDRTLAADDMRYRGRGDYASPDTSTPFLLHATGAAGRDTWWYAGITLATIPADDILIGLVIGDVEDDDWTWFGVFPHLGTNRVGWVRYAGHELGALQILGTFNPLAPCHLRVRDKGGGAYAVQANATNPADWSAVPIFEVDGGSPRGRWGGPGIVGTDTSATGLVRGEWDYYFDRAPRGPGRLSWQAFRDPLLPGAYDLNAADLVIQRVKQAHRDATPITHRKGLYTDDPTTLLDRDPMRT